MVANLLRLEEWMDERDFPRDDELFVLVKRAHNAMHDLFNETHELRGCGRAEVWRGQQGG